MICAWAGLDFVGIGQQAQRRRKRRCDLVTREQEQQSLVDNSRIDEVETVLVEVMIV
jgi:hypothetical protein